METKSAAPKIIGWISAGIGALGAFLLLRPLDGCGRVLDPDLSAAQLVDVFSDSNSGERRCIELLESATVPAWVVFSVAVLLAITAIIVGQMNKRQVPAVAAAQQPAAPTVVTQIEALVALRDQEKITEEEFQSLKVSVIARDSQPSS